MASLVSQASPSARQIEALTCRFGIAASRDLCNSAPGATVGNAEEGDYHLLHAIRDSVIHPHAACPEHMEKFAP